MLSWWPGKDKKPVGVLSRLRPGEPVLVTIGDFSTVLAMGDRGARDMLFALLRRIYDGHITRNLGNAPRAPDLDRAADDPRGGHPEH